MDFLIDNIKQAVKQSYSKEITTENGVERAKSTTNEEDIFDERSVRKSSTKECYDDDDDPYAVDLSMLKNLPKSIILDAIEYAKAKRKEEERKEREKDNYKRLKCIPPWAKSYGGKQLETCVSTSTQYDIPSYIKLAEEEEAVSEIEEEEDEYVHSSVTDLRKAKKEKAAMKLSVEIAEEVSEHSKKKTSASRKGSMKGKEDFDDDSTSTRTGSIAVGVQIQPSTNPFGMQTGHDSLTEVQSELSQLELTPSQISALPEEDRKQLLSSGAIQLDEQYLAGLASEERFSLTAERPVSLAGLASEEWLAQAAKSPVGGSKESLKRTKQEEYIRGESIAKEYLKGFLKGEEEEEEEDGEEEGEEASVELLGEGQVEECLLEEQGFEKLKKAKIPGKDTAYLKDHFSHILPKILAEIAWKRPPDPVHYLAHRLYSERTHQQIREQMICMRASLKQERENMRLPSGEMEPIKTFGFFERNLKGITMDDNYDELLEEQGEEEYRQLDEAIEEQSPEIR